MKGCLSSSFLVLAFLVSFLPRVCASSYSAFTNDGELRVAIESYMSNGTANDTAQVMAKYGPIDVWNVSLVTDFKGLFQDYASFNGNISNWDTQSVTNMDRLFFGATSFNGDLSKWNTAAVTSMISTFQDAKAFNTDISAWNVAMVKTMGDMFRGASSFNKDISFWNVEAARDMSTMFWEATSFNIDLSKWKVIVVKDLSGMFKNATAFDQKLCWQFREDAIIISMFCGSKGGTISPDCICSHDLYYDEKCVRKSTLEETTCDPPSLKENSAAATRMACWNLVLGMVTWVTILDWMW